jgi:perosamine synthetase
MSGNENTIFWSKPSLGCDESKLALNAIESTWVSGGDFVNSFEKKLSEILQVQNVVSVNNGTSAIMLALIASGLKPNDTIIVPAYGFMAAANVALILNLKIIFADVYKDTWNININSISNTDLISAKAVIGIDTYGNPCNSSELNEVASHFKLKVIQDCAESLGSTVNNVSTGTQVDIGTFSFHATKLITTGEGGAIVTNNHEFAEKAKLFRSHGMDRQIDYLHALPGNNLRLSNILAAIGVGQLNKFQEFKSSRKNIDTQYRNLFGKDSELGFQSLSSNDAVPWSFPILLNQGMEFRDKIQKKLRGLGIETRTGFKSPKYLKYFNVNKSFKNADFLSENVLSLPAYPGLREEQIEFIYEKLMQCVDHD